MPIATDVDWEKIMERKQKLIDQSNARENSKRITHTYAAGDLVTVKRPGIIPKLALPRMGPYKVIQHHEENGTFTIQTQPFVTDRVNQRRVQPFYSKR